MALLMAVMAQGQSRRSCPRTQSDSPVVLKGSCCRARTGRRSRWLAARGRAGLVVPVFQTSRMGSVAAATRTLRRDIASFTGREAEIAHLVAAVAEAASSGGVVGICAIGGMAGIGKTTLRPGCTATLLFPQVSAH
jgi:hypothetical protein